MLVEPSAYAVNVSELMHKLPKEKKRGTQKTKLTAAEKAAAAEEKKQRTKERKEYAQLHGVRRGSADGKHDEIPVHAKDTIDQEAADEGLHVLVQASTCRRRILTEIYGNADASSSFP
jgi:hypothetical protein